MYTNTQVLFDKVEEVEVCDLLLYANAAELLYIWKDEL